VVSKPPPTTLTSEPWHPHRFVLVLARVALLADDASLTHPIPAASSHRVAHRCQHELPRARVDNHQWSPRTFSDVYEPASQSKHVVWPWRPRRRAATTQAGNFQHLTQRTLAPRRGRHTDSLWYWPGWHTAHTAVPFVSQYPRSLHSSQHSLGAAWPGGHGWHSRRTVVAPPDPTTRYVAASR